MRRFRSLLLALAALASLAAVAIPAGSAQGVRATRSVGTVRSTGKLTPRLAALAIGRLAGRSRVAQARALSLPETGAGSLARSGNRILVDVLFSSGAARQVNALRAAGARIVTVSSRDQQVTAFVAPSALRAVAAVKGVHTVMESLQPMVSSSTCPQGTVIWAV